jgi:hypothetical protein
MRSRFGLACAFVSLLAVVTVPVSAQQQTKQSPAPAPPRSAAQQKAAQTVTAIYVGAFQKQVDLSDDQLLKASPILDAYVRRQQMLADQRTNRASLIQQMLKEDAPSEDILGQLQEYDKISTQQANTQKNFFADVDPILTVAQRVKLRIFLEKTAQMIRQLIAESTRNTP